MSDSEDEVSNLLECSICLDICQIPIIQCKNGHNVCKSHMLNLDGVCPICRAFYSDGSVRNLLAEKLVLKLQKKLEKRRQQQLRPANPKLSALKMTPRATHTFRAHTPPQITLCKYSGEQSGCNYRTYQDSTMSTHEENCHYREIRCCLETDGCLNAQIQFGEYLNHLQTQHNVKTFEEASHLHKYFVNAAGKLVRNGSSSVFILQTGGHKFVVTAKECNGRIYVWVALHGVPSDAITFKTKITLETRFSDDDEDDFAFSGIVRATTRQSLTEILRLTPCWLVMEAEDVQDGFETCVFNKGKFIRKHWSVNISIARHTIRATVPTRNIQTQSAATSSITAMEHSTQHFNHDLFGINERVREAQTARAIAPNLPASEMIEVTVPARNIQAQSINTSVIAAREQMLQHIYQDIHDLRIGRHERAPESARAISPSATSPPARNVMSEFARDFYESGNIRNMNLAEPIVETIPPRTMRTFSQMCYDEEIERLPPSSPNVQSVSSTLTSQSRPPAQPQRRAQQENSCVIQ